MSQLTNPYIGPRTFTRQERDRFFGREREARDLFSLVVSERLVLFYAQSGAGKSSLVNARLVPQLHEAGFAVLPSGRVSGELPAGVKEVGNIFTFNLMLNLDQSGGDPQCFARLPLTDFLTRLVSADEEHYFYEADVEAKEGYIEAPHVLIIDQFEEIITTHSARWPEREDFFRQLDRAMTDDSLLWVVLTFREDYLAAIEPYASLLTDKMRARFYMPRMAYESALEAVKKPADQAGRPFAAGVAESLVDNLRQLRLQSGLQTADHRPPEGILSSDDEPLAQEIAGGQPPHREASHSAVGGRSGLGQFVEPVQLQVVCYQLWEKLKARLAAEITRQDLQELGDVDTALIEFYEQALARVLAETGETEINLRDWFERKLITEAGTRGSIYRGVDKTEGISTRAADLLVNQFLLRTENRAGGIWYELVHDRLVEPIGQSNQTWREQQPLLQIARSWAISGQNERQLLVGPALQEALDSNWRSLGPLVVEFITASQTAEQAREAALLAEKEAQRQHELEQARALAEAEHRRAEAQTQAARRLRWIIAALAATLVVLMGLVGVAVYAFIQRQEVLISHQAITTSLPLNGRLYAAVAPDGRTIRLTDTAQDKLLYSLAGHTAAVTKFNLSDDTTYLASSDASGVTIVWDLRDGQPVAKLEGHTDVIRYVVFSPDGRLMATGGDDGTTHVWDTSTWQPLHVLKSDGGSIISVAFWRDSSLLVTATTDRNYTIWNPWTGQRVK